MKHVLLEYQAALFLALFTPIYVLLLRRRSAPSHRLFYLCSAVSFAALLALNALNLNRAGFLWHDEPNILSIAAAYLHGQPMYHDRAANAIYSLLYGPSTYLVYLPFLKLFSQPIPPIRLAGFVINLANVAMLYLTMKQHLSRATALCLLSVAVGYLLSLPNHMFGIRGDQILLLCIAAALLCVQQLPPMPAALAAGVFCGFALDFKFTTAPVVCLLLYLLWRRGRQWQYAATATALTIAITACPFLLHGISWRNYLSWLALSRQQGFQRDLLTTNLMAAVFLLLPGIILRLGNKRTGNSKPASDFDLIANILFAVSLCSCTLTGSKNGAGPWHLWPLLPFIMLWTSDIAARSGIDSAGDENSILRARKIAGAIAIATMIVTLRAGYRDLRILHPTDEMARRSSEVAEEKEIAGWIAKFPGHNIAMGYGREADDPRSSERFELALAGEDYFLDESALIESIKEKLPMSPELQQRILGCHDLWLIPHGEEPFATLRGGDMPDARTPYLFPANIRTDFIMKHTLLSSGESYDVWGCNLPPHTNG